MFLIVLIAFCAFLLAALGGARKAEGCFVVVAGRDASSTGRVLIGHNEDNLGELIMRHSYVPPAEGGGGLVSFEDGSAKIPRPERSLGFFWTETLRPAPGESFGDTFVNELGVVVTSNNCGPSKEDAPNLSGGGIGWALRLLVAERARSARDAVQIASELVLKYGYLGSGRSYTFADCREAWVFQAVNGRHFAAQRVPDDHVMTNPNHYSIRGMDLNNPDRYLASPGLIEYAKERGWYKPKKPGDDGDFDFAEAYQHPDCVMTPKNTARHSFGFAIAAGANLDLDRPGARPPFSLRPARPLSLLTLRETLSCHCEHEEDAEERSDSPHSRGVVLPGDGEAREFSRICNGGSMESLIVDLTEDPDETTVWSCFGNPCILPMTPWRLGARAVPELFSGARDSSMGIDELIERHFRAGGEYVASRAPEAWSVSRELVEWCDADYPGRARQVEDKLSGLRRSLEESNGEFESSFPIAGERFFSQASRHAELTVDAMRGLIGR
jgi:dipeptidase